MPTDREMRGVSERIEALIAELERVQDVAVRNRVEELVRALMQLHGEALARIIAALQNPGVEAGQAIERFAADPVVASVLMLYDLHPHDVRMRVERALEVLRPALGDQVDLTLLGVGDETVRVRIAVAPGECGTAADRIGTTVDAAIRDAAPDVREVEVETVRRSPAPASFIQLTRR
jgi:hypothetical protein